MKFSIPREKLSRMLYLASSIVERRNTMPIIANVKLKAESGSLAISATDLELGLLVSEEADVEEPGSITVGAKVIYEIVKELSDGNVSIRSSEGQRLEINAGHSRFKINGTSAEEFPSVPGVDALTGVTSVEALKIIEMIDKTIYAISSDETKFNLGGIYVETVEDMFPGGAKSLRFVSTDGHRIAIIDRPADGLDLERGVIVPRKGINEIKKILEGNDGSVAVSITEGYFSLRSATVSLGVRLVDGRFPDYSKVIPTEKTTSVKVDRAEFYSAVKRVSLLTTDKSKTLKFVVADSSLTVSSSSPEYGEATETIDIEKTGKDLAIGFSAKYLIDFMQSVSESEAIDISLSGEVGPALFSTVDDDFYRCVIMPMRFE